MDIKIRGMFAIEICRETYGQVDETDNIFSANFYIKILFDINHKRRVKKLNDKKNANMQGSNWKPNKNLSWFTCHMKNIRIKPPIMG